MQDCITRINAFNHGRLPQMLPFKYQFMAENMFRFYRGTAHLFYEDLAKEAGLPESPLCWVSGDLHLENFGTFKGDNRLVYFDINDFDDALQAPAAWELTRAVTSIIIACRSMGVDEDRTLRMSRLFLNSYASTLAGGKAKYVERKTARGIICDFLTAVANRKYNHLLNKRTVKKKQRLSLLLDETKHFKLAKGFKQELKEHLENWLVQSNDSPYHYQVEDAVFRVAGTGSIGVQRYAILLRRKNTEGRYLLLDMKQAIASSMQPFVKHPQPDWEHEAARVIAIQRRMQNVSPALLSATIFKDTSFIIQEMQPVKDNFNFKFVKDRYRDMYEVIDDIAMLTASAQLRSSGRQGSAIADELIAFGQDTSWQDKVLEYSMHHSQKTAGYYQAFLEAMPSLLSLQAG